MSMISINIYTYIYTICAIIFVYYRQVYQLCCTRDRYRQLFLSTMFFLTLHGLVVCSIADVSLWLSSVRIYIQYETGFLEHSEKIDDMGRPMIF